MPSSWRAENVQSLAQHWGMFSILGRSQPLGVIKLFEFSNLKFKSWDFLSVKKNQNKTLRGIEGGVPGILLGFLLSVRYCQRSRLLADLK